MADKHTGPDSSENQQTRRQFIRKLLVASAYAAPVISSFSDANAASSDGFSFKVKSKKDPSPMMSPSGMGMSMSMGTGMLWS